MEKINKTYNCTNGSEVGLGFRAGPIVGECIQDRQVVFLQISFIVIKSVFKLAKSLFRRNISSSYLNTSLPHGISYIQNELC